MIRNWIHATSVKEINRRLRNEEVRQAIVAVDAEEHAENERVDDVELEQAVDDVVHANNDRDINDEQEDYDQNDNHGVRELDEQNELLYEDVDIVQSEDEGSIDLDAHFVIVHQIDDQEVRDVDEYLFNFLKQWAMRGVSFRKVDKFLVGLRRVHGSLPKFYKTLLHTPRRVDVQPMGEGLVWYKSITTCLNERVTDDYLLKHREIIIDINIDGLQLFKSTDDHFWPILGCLKDEVDPFIIGVWHGVEKPENVDEYLEDFVQEVDVLAQNGYNFHGAIFPFKIRNYILDAVARQYIKCVMNHNSRYGCDKCTVAEHRFRNRQVFLDPNAPLRTDESFLRREQPDYHDGVSPLEQMRSNNNRMVSQFRLDSMHLLFEGAFKRWVQHLFSLQALTNSRISVQARFNICSDMVEIAPWIPIEFSRRPRTFYYQAKFKATEWRRILLYDGVRIFKHRLYDNTYKNFLLIHCASYILSFPTLVKSREWIVIADNIYREFIRHSTEVFDESFVSYNVHCLSHLAAECENYGTIMDFSAFKYESFLSVIKHCLRSTYKPLQQLANRDFETKGFLMTNSKKVNLNNVILKKQVYRDIPEIRGNYYAQISFKGITLIADEANCCFSTKGGDTVVFKKAIETVDGSILLVGHKFLLKSDYYNYPANNLVVGCCGLVANRRRNL